MIELFKTFPKLKDTLPHVSLGSFPAPVERLARLGQEAGLDQLYIKRDDLSAETYGGNKVRKLEFLLARAKKEQAGAVLTFGCAGSNHALATAIYARKLGLKCYSMLLPQPNARNVRHNLLLGHCHGAELHHFQDEESLRTGTRDKIAGYEKKQGKAVFIIPPGGSSELGAIGFVNAAFELKMQIEQGEMPEPDLIYVASGTMGTCIGLKLGLKAAGLNSRLIPIRVAPAKFSSLSRMEGYFRETNAFLHSLDSSFPELELKESDTELRHDFYGPGYAAYTREGMEAVKRMYTAQNIKLEGTYTGKTLAALLSDAKGKDLKNKVVLFWNTYNSRDLSHLIKDTGYHQFPEAFHRYFQEDVQALDRDG